ncbi:MAG: hypothetical protein ACYDHU_03895 [Acidimicrobiales bacterium]
MPGEWPGTAAAAAAAVVPPAAAAAIVRCATTAGLAVTGRTCGCLCMNCADATGSRARLGAAAAAVAAAAVAGHAANAACTGMAR